MTTEQLDAMTADTKAALLRQAGRLRDQPVTPEALWLRGGNPHDEAANLERIAAAL